MKRQLSKQNGFTVLEGLLVLVVLGILGFVGYKVVNTQKTLDSTDRGISSSEPVRNNSASREVPAVNSASDLDKADQSLDKTDPSDGNEDLNQFDNQLSSF